MPINNRIAAFAPDMTAWRRDLHRHPELGFAERRTSGIVAEKLRSWGIEVTEGIAGTGLVGTLRHGGSARAIGLRADMDALPMTESQDIDAIVFTPIISLPDEPFFDVVTRFLRSLDAVFFNEHGLQAQDLVRIRSVLARRLIASNGWHHLADSGSASVEVHIGPAIAAFFFNDHDRFQPTKCYLFPKAIDRLDPFLPLLETLVESGPSFFTALITLNLLEVTPRPAHLLFMVMAAHVWLKSYPDSAPFWIDSGTGHRVCALIDVIWRTEPVMFNRAQTLRNDVDQLLVALVRIGVAEAARLERALLASTPDG